MIELGIAIASLASATHDAARILRDQDEWASCAFDSCVGALIGGTIGVIGLWLFGRVRTARRLAGESEEVECDLLSVTDHYHQGRHAGYKTYRFRIPALPPPPVTEVGYREASPTRAHATAPEHHATLVVIPPRATTEPFGR